MSWPLNIVEEWVSAALSNIGYNESQATLGAQSVVWLQQRDAPGVAAMAQHIDFLSAYKLTPNQDGDADANCPIILAHALRKSHESEPSRSFKDVRQPLLLIPTLAAHNAQITWNDVTLPCIADNTHLSIDHDRKTLRAILVEKADVHWTVINSAPSNRHMDLLTEIPSRELVYVKTIQHYAGTLPPREPLDGADTTDNPASAR